MTQAIELFPQAAADKVLEWARKLGVSGVDTTLNIIRTMVGDPNALMHMATDLRNNSAGQLHHATHNLESATHDLASSWTGAGSDAAQTRINKYIAVSGDGAAALNDIAGHVDALLKILTDSYKEGVAHIVNCATALVDFESSTASLAFDFLDKASLGDIGKAFVGKAAEALNKFIKEFGKLFDETVDHFTRISGEIKAVQEKIALFEIPDDIGAIATEAATWEPMPKTHGKHQG
ncbi:hypothetical protein Srot_2926 [Segniliparus rotundus DSM 44985]|uniref:Uncharacterized protein n=1 Tax=Segniliparus rotundus (strain ATCC BAA-972 / CDC 1076 / CIP 108378 / DSM 44985 / JCM 13578) TaxID=640132 RepID=D6ZDU8_SEGRD|nr:hypothetical protein [Segniliparus rotundus]ADG99355.1 hypothetical protein Srot_2926 [Segniliparus rotundus DSM 44985]